MAPAYEPAAVEQGWYERWMEAGAFRAADESDKPPYCIVIPPPNVTGSLHMGHAIMVVIEDVLIRWKRMAGFNALWLPGTDHAGIATQMVVERELLVTEGKSRHDIGREAFLERVWGWKGRHGSRITEQMKVLGSSPDWDRERFTLDDGLSAAVREVFVRLHEEGLIYRAERLINWCPRCMTALSDLEVDHDESVKGRLWDFAYPISEADGGGEIVVSTTRPETMLGDTAVAVHPDDPRYEALIGKTLRHPFVDRELQIVGDDILVDPEFGTGAVKVTPAHDFNDFDTGQRHGLPMVSILDDAAHIVDGYGEFSGLSVKEARTAVLAALDAAGLARGDKEHVLSVGGCQRCDTVVEPKLSTQWFVQAKPLADPALEAVRSGRTQIIPEMHAKVYFHWLENIRDWCISRQLWWGHRIPAWFCEAQGCGEVMVLREAPTACSACGGGGLRQDEDVLDTWFSSALWPFSTLGWPDKTPALSTFYPTDVLETGYDILFFWVARMMMMGIHFMGEVPFKTVYLHGLVRDAKGDKMSKTRGNVVDPLDVTAEYGADALRFTLMSQAGLGRDIKLNVDSVGTHRAFCNKIWQATRFAMPHLTADSLSPVGEGTLEDAWLLSRLDAVTVQTQEHLDNWRFDAAAMGLYHFFWGELCDWYIEAVKPRLYGADAATRAAAGATLNAALDTALRLLHPFMPYITEELRQRLPGVQGGTITAAWPAAAGRQDAAAEARMKRVMGLVSAIRNVRTVAKVKPNQRVAAFVRPSEGADALDAEQRQLIVTLARLTELGDGAAATAGTLQGVAEGGDEVFVEAPGDIFEDLQRQLAKAGKELERCEKKLANPNFVDKAPPAVVDKERGIRDELADRVAKIRENMANYQAAP